MKRILLVVAFVAAAAALAGAQDLSQSMAITAAITPRAGLLYNGVQGLDLAALGMELGASFASGSWVFEAGSEAGTGSAGWQVLFPLRAGVHLGGRQLGGELLVEASPGLALTKPVLFMAAGGADARVTLAIGKGWEFLAALGVRITSCPAYESFAGVPYLLLDAPLSFGVRWTPGAE